MSNLLGLIARVALFVPCFAAHAAVGMVELPANAAWGPMTVFYPTSAVSSVLRKGSFELEVALDSVPSADASRLVVISHGSPGSPWVHLDLVRALVNAGFVVALPEHHADNYKDDSDPGPPAWRRRPQEISRAIDRLAQEPAFAPTLDFARIGMFGISAGGHTALTLAGGRWSASRLRTHCRLSARKDRWLNPRYHSDVIAQACGPCVRLFDSETGGHGALLGPLPPSGAVSDRVGDPPEFDRGTEVPKLNSAITDYFRSTLRDAAR